MSRLTVTEKEHWKSRIERRIDKSIDAYESKDSMMLVSIKAQAAQAAHDKLGTGQMQSKLEALKLQIETLNSQCEELQTAIYAKPLGIKLPTSISDYTLKYKFTPIFDKLRERFEEEFLQAHPIGKEILKLRHEKESLLDTVWLATSSTQIRDLWMRVSTVIGDDATELQQQILASTSDENESE